MLRFLAFTFLLGSAASTLAQNNAPSSNPHPEPSNEAAWLEMMPAPLPPPLHSQAPAAGAPVRSIRLSGGVAAANVLKQVAPVYPPEARSKQISGTVVLSAKIGLDGSVQKLEAVSGPDILRGAALDAVRQWTYRPYLLDGNPVTVLTTVNINFNLQQPAQP